MRIRRLSGNAAAFSECGNVLNLLSTASQPYETHRPGVAPSGCRNRRQIEVSAGGFDVTDASVTLRGSNRTVVQCVRKEELPSLLVPHSDVRLAPRMAQGRSAWRSTPPPAGVAMILNRTGIARRGATIGHPASAGSRMPGLRKHGVVLNITRHSAPLTGRWPRKAELITGHAGRRRDPRGTLKLPSATPIVPRRNHCAFHWNAARTSSTGTAGVAGTGSGQRGRMPAARELSGTRGRHSSERIRGHRAHGDACGSLCRPGSSARPRRNAIDGRGHGARARAATGAGDQLHGAAPQGRP